MPIYEYTCKKCSAKSEHYMSLNAAEKPACPKCGSVEMEKIQFSSFAVGSGDSAKHSCGNEPSSCHTCCGGHPCSHKH